MRLAGSEMHMIANGVQCNVPVAKYTFSSRIINTLVRPDLMAIYRLRPTVLLSSSTSSIIPNYLARPNPIPSVSDVPLPLPAE